VETQDLKEVWIALPLSNESQLENSLKKLQNCLVTVRYIPDIFSLRLLSHVPTRVADLLTIELNSSPLRGAHRFFKTVFDYVFSVCALILLSPILIIASVTIKLTSPGPVFFTQWRHGSQGKPIRIYKFRTMYEDSEEDRAFVQATKHDPRVTPVGRFLRRTSLDELPQFINVLQGRLSVVGPRPHAIAHNDEFKDQISAYMQRHRVKPGITGWAQVNGYRGETDTLEKMRKRIEFDLFYIENWSFWLDLKIIFLTTLFLFGHENAY
jgi:putative colanic acid biosynthesis UDP-glucose lipid carrier transferase